MEYESSQNFYKKFFIKYGILMAFFAVFFFIAVYSSIISRKAWQNNLKDCIGTVLESKYPNEWTLEKSVKINSTFSMNAICYEARNRKTGEVSKVITIRAATFYGPLPLVFLVSSDNNVTFVGYTSVHGKIASQIENLSYSVRVSYWQKRVLEILGGVR
jgi:hypothetical protein